MRSRSSILRYAGRRLLHTAPGLAGLLVLAVASTAGIAFAAIPGGDGKVSACYAKQGGALRVIDKAKGQTCKASERPLVWNQRGLRGATGPIGPAGANGTGGAAGAQGPAGPEGQQGPQGDQGPEGPPGFAWAVAYVFPDAGGLGPRIDQNRSWGFASVRSPETGLFCLKLEPDYFVPIDQLAPMVSGNQTPFSGTPLAVIAPSMACEVGPGAGGEIAVWTYLVPHDGGPMALNNMNFTIVIP